MSHWIFPAPRTSPQSRQKCVPGKVQPTGPWVPMWARQMRKKIVTLPLAPKGNEKTSNRPWLPSGFACKLYKRPPLLDEATRQGLIRRARQPCTHKTTADWTRRLSLIQYAWSTLLMLNHVRIFARCCNGNPVATEQLADEEVNSTSLVNVSNYLKPSMFIIGIGFTLTYTRQNRITYNTQSLAQPAITYNLQPTNSNHLHHHSYCKEWNNFGVRHLYGFFASHRKYTGTTPLGFLC